jgi:hypothetical protein
MESKRLSDFDDSWQLIVDSQDIAAIKEIYGFWDESAEDITAFVILVDDDCITDIYATEANAPYLLDSEYMPIDYWRNL